MRISILKFVLLLSLLPIVLSGQNPFFSIVDFDKEVSGAKINKIIQDPNGYILLGTTDGLYRYDGELFIPVNHSKNFAF